MFIPGIIATRQYAALPAFFNLATASYDAVSFSTAGQDSNLIGVTFKPDGTKMYTIPWTGGDVHQYSLSVAWDVSSTTYDSKSFNVNTQQTGPRDLRFSTDGTKMYVVGYEFAGDVGIHQYSLSVAWDLSTASYSGVFFDVSSQDPSPQDLAFNDTGTKLYLAGFDTNIYQYSLSVAWDLSTASYDSVSFGVTPSMPASAYALSFSADGAKMYTLSLFEDFVWQYSLSVPWDLSTASYDSVNFNIAGQVANPTSVAFRSDDNKMYIADVTNNIYQYSD